MDVYLPLEAFRSLEALNTLNPSSGGDGLLIGHKRGHRYFIEKIFPTHKGFFSSCKKYLELNTLFDNKVIGFFSFRPNEKKMKKIFKPFAYGQLFIELRAQENKKIKITPYVIDFENDFFITPIPLKREK